MYCKYAVFSGWVCFTLLNDSLVLGGFYPSWRECAPVQGWLWAIPVGHERCLIISCNHWVGLRSLTNITNVGEHPTAFLNPRHIMFRCDFSFRMIMIRYGRSHYCRSLRECIPLQRWFALQGCGLLRGRGMWWWLFPDHVMHRHWWIGESSQHHFFN